MAYGDTETRGARRGMGQRRSLSDAFKISPPGNGQRLSFTQRRVQQLPIIVRLSNGQDDNVRASPKLWHRQLTRSRWDTLTGRKSSPSATGSGSGLEAYDDFVSQPFDPTSAQDVSQFLIDPAQLHPLANLSKDTLEYLTLEDSVLSDLPGNRSALPSRGWSDDLCYGAGVTYLAALSMGAST